MKSISVICASMASYDYVSNFIRSCLDVDALNIDLDSSPQLEVCIHFDGANAKSIAELEWYADAYNARAFIKYSAGEHKGQSYSLNQAYKLADPRSEYIMWACDDFVFPKNWAIKWQKFLQEDRYIILDLMEPTFGSFPPIVDGISQDPKELDFQKLEELFSIRPSHRKIEYANLMSAGIFHKHVFDSVNGLNEKFDPYTCNDISFLWETFLANPSLIYVTFPEISVYHYQKAAVNAHPEIRERSKIASDLFKRVYGLEMTEAIRIIKERNKNVSRISYMEQMGKL